MIAIASIGVGIRKWVTYHGFALNVTTDLSYFRRIHLCGLKGREATSIAEEKGCAPPMEAVRKLTDKAAFRQALELAGEDDIHVRLVDRVGVVHLAIAGALMRETGLVDYWRQTGEWGDVCRPVGDDDFECS